MIIQDIRKLESLTAFLAMLLITGVPARAEHTVYKGCYAAGTRLNSLSAMPSSKASGRFTMSCLPRFRSVIASMALNGCDRDAIQYFITEFCDNTCNENTHPSDPLAPDTLFATMKFSIPLGWIEAVNLPNDYIAKTSTLVTIWRMEREAIFSGITIPIGCAPDGVTWTGFSSVSDNRNSEQVVHFREFKTNATWTTRLPLLNARDQHVTVLSGDATGTFRGSCLSVAILNRLEDFSFG